MGFSDALLRSAQRDARARKHFLCTARSAALHAQLAHTVYLHLRRLLHIACAHVQYVQKLLENCGVGHELSA